MAAKVSTVSLGRLRKSLRRHLSGGWERAVFAQPEAPGGPPPREQVVHGPGKDAAADLEDIIDRAEQAARAGLVKQTYVLDHCTRIKIDARHGRAKRRVLDADTTDKIMGGKQRTLRPDESAQLLRAIGIMNADGSISAKNAKKYKQVNHLAELCRPAWEAVRKRRALTPEQPLRIVDLACGNSYLSFILAEVLEREGIPARILGIDRRADVISTSRARSEALGFEGLRFLQGSITEADDQLEASLQGPVDMVVALHACDTATDEALALALRHRVAAIFAVPCCQRQLARQLATNTPAPTPSLTAHGLLRREYAALLTDALRAEILEVHGYRVDVMEFVSEVHTPKNLLLRARRHPASQPEREAMEALRRRCTSLGVEPALLDHLA